MISIQRARSMILVLVALAPQSTVFADDWARNFRIGMNVGFNIKADFKMGGQFAIGNGDATGPNYEFDDGYVKVDQTGNAGGYTSNWGYDTASQHPTANTLLFHSANAFATPTTQVERDDSPYIAFEMAYGGTIKRWNRTRLGWELGIGFLPIDIKDERALNATFNNTTYTFDVPLEPRGNTPIILPQPGYRGGPEGIGATIPGTPSSQSTAFDPGTITGTRELDLMLYSFRLGPTMYWALHRRWGVSVSAGPALGIVTGDYRFNETGHTSSGGTFPITGKFGNTDVVYGGYANALALFHWEEHGDIFAGVQFMSLTGTTFSSGGREAKLNLGSAFYLTAGINWPF